jgi:transposase
MANRRISVIDLSELLRLLRAGESDRSIAGLMRRHRETVRRYREWAAGQGLLAGPLPREGELQRLVAATLPSAPPPQQVSSVAAYAEEIREYRARGMEVAAIRARLEEVHRHPVSYPAVWRLVRRLEPASAGAVVRVEVAPGAEAQVDFGYAGPVVDPATGKVRKGWVFAMVLSFSRHLYAEVVFDQRVETWLLCHRHAFEAFGGAPARVVPDNLKAAVVRASFTEPEAQRAYRECAAHYGFLIAPQPPRQPHLKGKVEQGGVHYVKRNFLAGRDPEPAGALNAKLRHWAREVAGARVHGTTRERPIERFERFERAALLPLPAAPYDPAAWKQAKVYRDCYVVFEASYYSAPFRLVGQSLWLRAGARAVELYDRDHQLVATHDRARAPGERLTHPDHLPPQKLPGLSLTREGCRLKAAAVGPATAELVGRLLAHRPEDRLRSAGKLLGLAQRHSPERLEAACGRALAHGEASYPTVRRILEQGLDRAPGPAAVAPAAPARPSFRFARQAGDFVAALLGGAR